MNLDLSGKTAVVCGSTQGLGLACAKELAFLGANIVLFARNEEKLRGALQELDLSQNQKHNYLVADFSNPGLVKTEIDNYAAKNTAQILINNTGGPAAGPALSATAEEFTQAFKSHLLCNHFLVQALVPGMKVDGFGRVVNIISTSVKQPIAGLGVSNTIRAAVANWSKTLAAELGPFGITVNNVLPGLTQTVRAEYVVKKKVAETGLPESEVISSMLAEIPAGRMGKPEEFGAVVAFLCTPAASYINGINLPVDGGRLGTL